MVTCCYHYYQDQRKHHSKQWLEHPWELCDDAC